MHGFSIGNVNISGNLILGPMAGVTDLPFVYCVRNRVQTLYIQR